MKSGWKGQVKQYATRPVAVTALRRQRRPALYKEGQAAPSTPYALHRAAQPGVRQAQAGYAAMRPPSAFAVPHVPAAPAGEAAARERRRQILQRVRGMWKDRGDTPTDGLRYQLEARAEWD